MVQKKLMLNQLNHLTNIQYLDLKTTDAAS